MNRPTIYIAGAMSGHPNLNHDRFDAAESMLEAHGWAPINPARLDREVGIDPSAGDLEAYDYEAAATRDLEVLTKADAIYLLDGWQSSKGAAWERAVAKSLGIPRYYEAPRGDHHQWRNPAGGQA